VSTPDRWDAAPCGLLVLDPDGTVAAANDQLTTWTGLAGDAVGRTRFGDLLSVGGRIYWETHLAPRLQLEGRLDEVTVELRGPQGRVPVLLTAVTDPGGPVRIALHGAAERMRFERELRSARQAAQQWADRVAVLQTVTAGLSRVSTADGVAQVLLAAATGPLGATSAAVWTATADGLRLHSVRGDHPTLPTPDVVGTGEGAVSAADGTVQVPLPGAEDLRGVLTLAHLAAPTPELDLPVLTAVAQQAGIALDRARLHEQSAGVARVLQRSMLTAPVQPDHLELATRYLPAAEDAVVGGDWYDAFLCQDGTTWLVVGDVAGHDIGAAAVMGQIRNLLRGIAYTQQQSPARVLTAVDQAMAGLGVPSLATVVALRVEQTPDDRAAGVRRVRWSNAGHPAPVHIPRHGTPASLTTPPELLLGAFPDVERTDHELDLHPGDTMLLYTDGLTERRHSDLDTGTRWLLDTLGRHSAERLEDLCDHLLRTVADHLDDDVALLALRAHTEDAPRPAEAGPVRLPEDHPAT